MSTFPKTNRLLNRQDFQATFDHGTKMVSRDLIVVQRPASGTEPRLGLVVTRKMGNAVARNRFKRNLREIFRRNKDKLKELGHSDSDFVVIARARSMEITQRQLESSFFWCLRKLQDLSAKKSASGTSEVAS